MPRPNDTRLRRSSVPLTLALVAGAAAASFGPSTVLAATSVPRQDAAGAPDAMPARVRRHLDAGAGLLARGEAALAVAEYRSALERAASGSEAEAIARYGLGLSFVRLGRHRDAVEALAPIDTPAARARAERVDRPWRAASLLLLGTSRRAVGDPAGALSAFDAAVAWAEPRDDAAIAGAARIAAVDAAWEAGAHDRVIELAAAAAPSAGADAPRLTWLAAAAAERLGDLETAATLAEAVVNATGGASRGASGTGIGRPARLLLGSCLERLGRTEEAARAYAALAPRRGDDAAAASADAVTVEAMAALAAIELSRGRADAVATRLSPMAKAFDGHPRDAQRTRLLARAHLASGAPAEAAAVIDAGLERHPDPDGRISWLRGRADLAVDRAADAAAWFARSLALHPGGPAARAAGHDRVVAEASAGRHDQAAEAAADFLARHASDPLAAPVRRLQAGALLDGGRAVEAIAACEAFRTVHADHELLVEVDLLAAEAAERTDDPEAAAEAWRGFIDRHPRDARLGRAQARLGLVLHASGEDDEAAEALAAAVDAGAADPTVLRAIGDIALRDSNWDAAAEALGEAVSAAGSELDWRTLARLAHACRRAERFEDAINACARLLAASEGSVPERGIARARLERGLALDAMGRTDAAEIDLERAAARAAAALETASDDDERRMVAGIRRTAIGRLASMAAESGRHEVAARRYALLEDGAAGDSERDDAAYRAAVALAAAGDHEAAAERFEAVASMTDDDDRRADCLARAALARCRLVEALPVRLADDANAASAADEMAAPRRAVLASVERALEVETPDSMRRSLEFERLRRLRGLGRDAEALAAGERFLHEHADSVEAGHAAIEVSDLLVAAGRPADAVRRLVPLVPEVADLAVARDLRRAGRGSIELPADLRLAAAWRLALASRAAGDHRAAAAAAEPVADRTADPILRRAALAVAAESLLAAGRPEDAAGRFEALAADDADPVARDAALLRLAECRIAQRRWAVAERHFDAYLERHPDDERWYAAAFGRGRAREQQGRIDAALADYRRVAETHDGPTAARAQFQIGQCLFVAGRHEDALRAFYKVEILFDAPQWTAAALHETASCLERLGRGDEARAALERLAREHPGTEWATRATRRLGAAATERNETRPGRAAGTPATEGTRP